MLFYGGEVKWTHNDNSFFSRWTMLQNICKFLYYSRMWINVPYQYISRLMGETKIILKNVFFRCVIKTPLFQILTLVQFCYAWSGYIQVRCFDLNPLSVQLLRNQRTRNKGWYIDQQVFWGSWLPLCHLWMTSKSEMPEIIIVLWVSHIIAMYE
jgi:hypothetical protein